MVKWLAYSPDFPNITYAEIPNAFTLKAWAEDGAFTSQVIVVEQGHYKPVTIGKDFPSLPAAQLAAHLKAIEFASAAMDYLSTYAIPLKRIGD